MLSDEAIQDYHALTEGIGRVELTNWTTISLTGDDRSSFLHNLCTNDIKSLQPGDQCEAFLTDVKGKIVAHVLVFAFEDRLQLLSVPDQGELIVQHLDRYLIREKVELADESNGMNWSVVTDSLSESFQSPFLGVPACIVSKVPDSHANLRVCSDEAFDALRLEAGWPLFGIDFDNTNLPQEVCRDERAIHFNKGCYLGQETIARIDALGHVNQELTQVKLSGDVPASLPADVFIGEKKVGQVTSASYSPKYESVIGLAMLRREAKMSNADEMVCEGAAMAILAP
ncbi:MAG: glycine cleavage T C-terminal barrel domain-containing protein [Lacipirellulaceae bacterium]